MSKRNRIESRMPSLGAGPIRDALRPFSTPSVLDLLETASTSPTASHALPSISILFDASLRRKRQGETRASARDLPALVAAAHTEIPELASFEDASGLDPRARVVVRWAGQTFRILPGALERPRGLFDRLQLLATVLDRSILGARGFRVSDVTELVLRRLDEVASVLAPAWPDGVMPAPGDPVSITGEELAIASRLRTFTDLPASCRSPKEARAALDATTIALADLTTYPTNPESSFGPVLAVRGRDRQVCPCPSGLMVEGLATIGTELAADAVLADPSLDARWRAIVATRAGHALAGAGHRILGQSGGRGAGFPLIVGYEGNQVLAVDFAASLAPTRMPGLVEGARVRLAEIRPGGVIEGPRGSVMLESRSDIARLLVLATPGGGHLMLDSRSEVVITLEDLLWFSRSSGESPSDLWHFSKEWVDPAHISTTFAWDMIDAWEVWRSNDKSLYKGGLPITMMSFAPHHAAVEWAHGSSIAPLEESLKIAGLPPVAAWPMLDVQSADRFQIGDLSSGVVFNVLTDPLPVFVQATDEATPSEFHDLLWSLASVVRWKLEHAREGLGTAATGSAITRILIQFEFSREPGADSLALVHSEGGRLTLAWSGALQLELLEGSDLVEKRLGQMVAQAFGESAREGFVVAWDAAPPGIRVDAVHHPQHARSLAAPMQPHPSIRAAVGRRTAEQLMAEGVRPGTFEGNAARDLETGRIHPKLERILRDSMSHYEPRSLLLHALSQLEAANAAHLRHLQKLAWQLGFPEHELDLEAQASEQSAKDVALSRTIALVVEELLARPPTGTAQPARDGWQELISIAGSTLESGLRSESIHLDLLSSVTEISDTYEIEYRLEGLIDIDMDRYSAARSSASLPAPAPIGDRSEEVEAGDPSPLSELLPELESLDRCLASTMGFGLDALAGLLNACRQWPVTDARPVGIATEDEIVAWADELVPQASREAIAAALSWLTIDSETLRDTRIEHWEVEHREQRIATRPFVALGEERYVLPWTSEAALRLLASYLSDRRLPWPASTLPDAVVTVQARSRQGQNHQLERDVIAALKRAGLDAFGPIKPQKAARHGLKKLGGEIDALAVDADRRRVWVVEAKDPQMSFSGRQLRRLVTDFLEPDGYVDRLLGKASDVRRDVDALLTKRGLAAEDDWVVLPLLVTRYPEAAAYATSPRVPFATLGGMLSTIGSSAMPEPGPAPGDAMRASVG